jgi:hypothetical protein
MHSAKAFALRAGINRRPYYVMLEAISLFYKIDRAKRFHPSTFDIRHSTFFGSLFSGSSVRFSLPPSFSSRPGPRAGKSSPGAAAAGYRMGSAGGIDFTKSQNRGLGVQFDFFDIGFRVFFFLCIHRFDSASVSIVMD